MPTSTVHRYRIDLAWRGRALAVQLEVPDEPITLATLAPLASRIADRWIRQAVDEERDQGRRVSCQAECAACCRQLAVLSIPEACHLLDAVARLDPSRRARVEQRLHGAVAMLGEQGLVDELMDPTPGEGGVQLPVAIEYGRLQLACPFLDGERCAVYADRPVACREQLVTSPAEHCAEPEARSIRKVPLPPSMSAVLAYVSAALLESEPRLLPLPLALSWLESQGRLPERTWPAAQVMDRFLAQLRSPGG